jgi:DNA-binding transcriptional MerR regulator
MATQSENPVEEDLIEISAVSRLTGLSTHNLRVWESRHGVVSPARSDSQRRLYSRDDVRKLGILKALVDRGFSIGRLSNLTFEQLEQRLAESETDSGAAVDDSHQSSSPQAQQRRCRIAIAGQLIAGQFRDEGPLRDKFRVVSEHGTLEELAEALRPHSADVLIIELATLFDDGIEEIQHQLSASKARRAVIAYRFASDSALQRIENDLVGITALRAPVNATEIRLACLAGMDLSPIDAPLSIREDSRHTTESLDQEDSSESAIPPHRFSPAELGAISELTSDVKCECPHHLANLITSLAAFEQYSKECENRNKDDARIHRLLHRVSAEARSSLESALVKVLAFEDLQIPS